MKISAMIQQLQQIQNQHGDLEVTVTGSFAEESQKPFSDCFDSTAETLHITDSNGFGKHVRILWQC